MKDTESISQASSSSTERPESVRLIGRSDDKMSHQFKSEVKTRSRHSRPHRNSNEPKQPNPVAASEVRKQLA